MYTKDKRYKQFSKDEPGFYFFDVGCVRPCVFKTFYKGEGQGDRRKNKYVKYVFGLLGTLTDRKKI